MTMRWRLAAGLLLLSACEKKQVPPDGAATVADSAATAADSTRRDSIIGYDSAFGPILRVDSAGELVEIPPRRP